MGSVALLLLFLAAVASKPTVDVGINLTPGLDSLFNSIDTNHDGELTVNEAEEFIRSGIGGADYDDNKEVHAAAMDMLSKLDSADIGSTVSPKELDHQLHAVLSGTRVADWVQHGLGLPQYAEQFRAHAVTPLDFPILIADGGRVLSTEFQVCKHGTPLQTATLSLTKKFLSSTMRFLNQPSVQVASKYHKEKILRAMKRQMLSLGSVPSSVQVRATCKRSKHLARCHGCT